MKAALENVHPGDGAIPLLDRESFLNGMGAVASGVTVVTTDGVGGRSGQTVSSFCSVSADPPQLLGCLRRESPFCAALEANQRFTINILSESQAHIADTFAGRSDAGEPYDFDLVDWVPDTVGCPRILSATASFGCLFGERVIRNSHFIYIGTVACVHQGRHPPLLYRRRQYGRYVPSH